MLLRHFRERGDARLLRSNLRTTAMTLLGQLWYKLERPVLNPPYSLVRLAVPACTAEEREWLATEVVKMFRCCAEEWFTAPFLTAIRDMKDLLSEEIRSLLWSIGKFHKVTNMHLECLLTYLSTSAVVSKRKPCSERICYASHGNVLHTEYRARGVR